MRLTIFMLLAAASAGALSSAVQAQSPPTTHTGTAQAPGAVGGATTTAVTAKVVAVDAAQRTVTLQSSGGKTRTIHVGDQVRNFDQIKVGDTVHARYTQALALELRKGGSALPAPTQEGAITPPPAPGAKPGGTVARRVTATAEVVAIDPERLMVTLRGPGGNEVDVQAQDPSQLQNIKKGDHIQATYVESLAIQVAETPAK